MISQTKTAAKTIFYYAFFAQVVDGAAAILNLGYFLAVLTINFIKLIFSPFDSFFKESKSFLSALSEVVINLLTYHFMFLFILLKLLWAILINASRAYLHCFAFILDLNLNFFFFFVCRVTVALGVCYLLAAPLLWFTCGFAISMLTYNPQEVMLGGDAWFYLLFTVWFRHAV